MDGIIIQHPKEDFAYIELGDKRLDRRLQEFVESSTKNAEKSILGAGQERGCAKAYYRLLANDKLNMEQLMNATSGSTLARMSGTVLLIQDTSDIDLNGLKKADGLGFCSEHIRGVKLHSCIAVNTEGLTLGLVTQSYETRLEAKSPLSKSEKAARPIEEKESFRWIESMREATAIVPEGVHFITVCDREGDFYELYAEAKKLETDFVIRVTHDRLSDSNEKIATKLRQKKASGTVKVSIPRDSRRSKPAREAEMEVAYCQVNVQKPASVHDKNIAQKLTMNLIRITEISPLKGQEAIEWILATSLPVNTITEAMTIVGYYIHRWKIERFHYVLKSGVGAERIQQRTYERIKPVLLIYSVIALFIMTITYMGRILPDAPCSLFLDDDEWKILYRIVHKTKCPPDAPYSMAEAVKYLAQLGGYKRAPSDGHPGPQSIWKGLFALYFAMDILVGQV